MFACQFAECDVMCSIIVQRVKVKTRVYVVDFFLTLKILKIYIVTRGQAMDQRHYIIGLRSLAVNICVTLF